MVFRLRFQGDLSTCDQTDIPKLRLLWQGAHPGTPHGSINKTYTEFAQN